MDNINGLRRNWYVVYTKPRQEETAKENLQRQGFAVYLPKLRERKKLRGKWSYSVAPLFSRYLFIQLALFDDNIAPLRSTRGVMDLVRFGEFPAEVPNSFIESLKDQEAPDIGCHIAETELQKGAQLEVTEGPFAGLIGPLFEVSSDERVTVLLNVLGRESKISMPTESVALL